MCISCFLILCFYGFSLSVSDVFPFFSFSFIFILVCLLACLFSEERKKGHRGGGRRGKRGKGELKMSGLNREEPLGEEQPGSGLQSPG